jgi:hypothetical protein
MDSSNNASRRSEDIALDLLKFVASHANLGSKGVTSTPGFAAPSAAKSEDQVTQILDLYARCRTAVETPTAK